MPSVCAGVLSRRLSSWLTDVRLVGHSVCLCIVTVTNFLSVKGEEYFSASVLNDSVLHGSLVHSALGHCDFKYKHSTT